MILVVASENDERMERVQLPMKHCFDFNTFTKEASGFCNAQNNIVMINNETTVSFNNL